MKKLKTIKLSFLIVSMLICIFGSMHVYATDNVQVSFEHVLNNDQKSVTIKATATTNEEYEILAIQMNEQERLEGSNVEYIVNKNNTYKFIVYYRSLSDENSSELTQEFIDEVTELSQQEDKIQNITPLSVGDNFIFNESTQTITGYNSGVVGAKDVIIPNQINGVDVLHIGDNTFAGMQLQSVKFETTKLQSIGVSAFSNNPLLKNIDIPVTVQEIGDSAFSCCESLTSIVIPNGITNISNKMFYACHSLTNVIIPDSVTNIGESAFSACISLKEVTIPNSVLNIGSDVFGACMSLTKIKLPNNITNIKSMTFYNCISLIDIIIPSSVLSIDKQVFYECKSLTSIVIPSNVTAIGEEAFRGCNRLKNITINGSDNISIDTNAFVNQSDELQRTIIFTERLKGSVESEPWGDDYAIIQYKDEIVPPGNIFIDNYVYNAVSQSIVKYKGNDNELTIPNQFQYEGKNYNVTNIGDYAFSSCSSLTSVTIPDSITNIGNYAFSSCGSLTSVTIPDSITKIGDSAFSYCSSLTSVTIPDSVTSIGTYVFFNCYLLKNITIEGENDIIIDQAAFQNDSDELQRTIIFTERLKGSVESEPWGDDYAIIQYKDEIVSPVNIFVNDYIYNVKSHSIVKYKGNDSELVIPSQFNYKGKNYDVNNIGTFAFSGCTSLTSVTIPDSVTRIDCLAFSDCISLTNVTIPDSVTEMIGQVFANCISLKSIVLPSRLYDLNHTFDWSGIQKIYVQQSRGSQNFHYAQPWGASNDAMVFYQGEYIDFRDNVVQNENGGFDININANIMKGGVFINQVTLPNDKIIRVGAQSWPQVGSYTYHVDEPGTYTFIGYDNKGLEYTYDVKVETVEIKYLENNESSHEKEKSDSVIAGKKYTMPHEYEVGFNKEKAIFKGWNTQRDGSGYSYQPNTQIKATQNLQLYADWDMASTGEVFFQIRNGDELLGMIDKSSFLGNVGDKLKNNTPHITEQSSGIFMGWYKEGNRIDSLADEEIVTGTVYEARFMIDNNHNNKDDRTEKYTVQFRLRDSDKDKASLNLESVYIMYGESLGINAAAFNIDAEIAPHVSFDGWYKDNVKVSNLASEVITDNVTYEARFDGNISKYRVNFQIDESQGLLDDTELYVTQIVDIGDKAVEPKITMKDKKSFVGWYVLGDDTQTLIDISKAPTEHITYVLKSVDLIDVMFQIRDKDITLGKLDKTSVEIIQGKQINASLPTIYTNNSSKFVGWYKDGIKVERIEDEVINETVTYEARFILDRDNNSIDDRTQTYKVTYVLRTEDQKKAIIDESSYDIVYGTLIGDHIPNVRIDKDIAPNVKIEGYYRDEKFITDISNEIVTDNFIYEIRLSGNITKYRVHYEIDEKDGYFNEMNHQYTYLINKGEYPIIPETKIIEGKKLIGWYRKDKPEILVNPAESMDEEVTYVAKVIDTSQITFEIDENDGIFINGKQKITKEIKIGEHLKDYIPEIELNKNKKMIGWYIENNQIADIEEIIVNEKDMTYKVKVEDVHDNQDIQDNHESENMDINEEIRDISKEQSNSKIMNILTGDHISLVPYILLFGVSILGIFIYKKSKQ